MHSSHTLPGLQVKVTEGQSRSLSPEAWHLSSFWPSHCAGSLCHLGLCGLDLEVFLSIEQKDTKPLMSKARDLGISHPKPTGDQLKAAEPTDVRILGPFSLPNRSKFKWRVKHPSSSLPGPTESTNKPESMSECHRTVITVYCPPRCFLLADRMSL